MSDFPCGRARVDRMRGHITANDAVGSDHSAVPYGDALKNAGTAPDPYVAANADRRSDEWLDPDWQRVCHAVVRVSNAGVLTDEGVLAYRHLASRSDDAPSIDSHMSPQRDRASIDSVEMNVTPQAAMLAEPQFPGARRRYRSVELGADRHVALALRTQ